MTGDLLGSPDHGLRWAMWPVHSPVDSLPAFQELKTHYRLRGKTTYLVPTVRENFELARVTPDSIRDLCPGNYALREARDGRGGCGDGHSLQLLDLPWKDS